MSPCRVITKVEGSNADSDLTAVIRDFRKDYFVIRMDDMENLPFWLQITVKVSDLDSPEPRLSVSRIEGREGRTSHARSTLTAVVSEIDKENNVVIRVDDRESGSFWLTTLNVTQLQQLPFA